MRASRALLARVDRMVYDNSIWTPEVVSEVFPAPWETVVPVNITRVSRSRDSRRALRSKHQAFLSRWTTMISARAETGACSCPLALSYNKIGIYDEHGLPEQTAPSEEEGKQRVRR
jgi:hypothetical protein